MKKHGQPGDALEMTDGRMSLLRAFRLGVANDDQQRLMANWLRDILAYQGFPPRFVEGLPVHSLLMAGQMIGAGEQADMISMIDRLRLGNFLPSELSVIQQHKESMSVKSCPPYALTDQRLGLLEALGGGIVGPNGQKQIARWIEELHEYLGHDPKAYQTDPLYKSLMMSSVTDINMMNRIGTWVRNLVENASKRVAGDANPVPTPRPSANDRQVGGDHYKTPGGIQHWDIAVAYELPYLAGQATKYVARARKKNGRQDLEKAMHFLEKLIETEDAALNEGAPPLPDLNEFGEQQGLTFEELNVLALIVMFERTGQHDLLHMAKAGLARLLERLPETVG